MQINLPYQNGYSRNVKIDPFSNEPGNSGSITVYQDMNVHTMQLESPVVSWASVGTVSPLQAGRFADGIKHAVQIAALWSADTGHPVPWPEMEVALPTGQVTP